MHSTGHLRNLKTPQKGHFFGYNLRKLNQNASRISSYIVGHILNDPFHLHGASIDDCGIDFWQQRSQKSVQSLAYFISPKNDGNLILTTRTDSVMS